MIRDKNLSNRYIGHVLRLVSYIDTGRPASFA